MFDTRFFCDDKGRAPVIEALDGLPPQAKAKAFVRIKRLAELGNRLKRPESDYLRDGIYELRWRLGKVQYRLLYFFAGKSIVVLSHIITKEKIIPIEEIEKCMNNKRLFESNTEKYSYKA